MSTALYLWIRASRRCINPCAASHTDRCVAWACTRTRHWHVRVSAVPLIYQSTPSTFTNQTQDTMFSGSTSQAAFAAAPGFPLDTNGVLDTNGTSVSTCVHFCVLVVVGQTNLVALQAADDMSREGSAAMHADDPPGTQANSQSTARQLPGSTHAADIAPSAPST